MIRLLLGTALCLGILALLGLNSPVSDESSDISFPANQDSERGPLVEVTPEEPRFLTPENFTEVIDAYEKSGFFADETVLVAMLKADSRKHYEESSKHIEATLRQRGYKEAGVASLGDNTIFVLVPGMSSLDEFKSILGLPAQAHLAFHLEVPSNLDPSPDEAALFGDAEIGTLLMLYKKPAMELDGYLLDARHGVASSGAQITISLSNQGAALFESVTAKNIGRRLAILMDGKVLTAPTIQQKISGGKIVITGNFTAGEASDLCQRMRSATSSRPFTILESRIIAPAVGKGVGS